MWFESAKSMSQVLSAENQELLRVIIANKPRSITELEGITNRKKSNLSRTLKTLEKYGIVELKKIKGKITPKVKATDFRVCVQRVCPESRSPFYLSFVLSVKNTSGAEYNFVSLCFVA